MYKRQEQYEYKNTALVLSLLSYYRFYKISVKVSPKVIASTENDLLHRLMQKKITQLYLKKVVMTFVSPTHL